ncbi:hypothetical protein [Bradyrhizobium diazoefficiens]|uniref:Uncharacterized protein n=1 Tax=Bradyrhizobium diazoefficiens TaxID=1355477 RepID=A0A0E4BWK7_9BRAD|nr:hypothetical protein [Bradyrhizobium diazoefficiens]BAR61776.1 hypothetical protein NK6_8627 [Bradyrhizobium diazoefficiens]BCA04060.1 hypothetical protein H12S4_49640 [Bradyrhizobium diazoefficiens]BCA21419.1 hypothetical protein BDHH15_46340 [Bradyrhizobium diazoefficiens]BCE39587.1 hypothetical protein XF3B_46180 [Bradyrhizobium diazoefficiens]BCF52984.1 hypothetical protein XF17B_46220 [Bradyrhizobium diazoefficiens]
MTELVRYEAARRALAEAVAVDEVAEIRSKAEALRHYARQAGDKTLEIQSAQLRFRAERKMGGLLAAAKEAGQISRGQPPKPAEKNCSESEQFFAEEPISRVTLEQAGIDRKLSSRAQRLAAMDVAEFEHALARHKEEMESGAGRVAMDLLKIDAEEKGRIHRRDLSSALASASALTPGGKKYPATLADPPWKREGGIGDRAYENHYPTMPWPEILDYLKRAGEALQPNAWAWMWIPRPHLLAKVPFKTEAMLADGECVIATVELPLAYACQLALGMDSYSTCYVWTKTDEAHPDVSGSGLLVWDQDELLLQFKRGRGLPKPASDEKFGSNHRERPREHSRKPDHYRHMIATMVGKDSDGAPLPVLELFARVDAEHPLPENWDAWGNQAGVALQSSAIANPTDAAASPSSAGDADSDLPVPSGEQVAAPQGAVDKAAAAEATDGASAAAAVADVLASPSGEVQSRAPYDAGDVVTIDQLAGSEWLAATEVPEFDPASIGEREALKILSDFCHPRRDLAPVLGAFYLARGYACQQGEQWALRGAGWDRLRELEAAELPPAPKADLTEPYRAPQMSLFDASRQLDDAPPAEVVDGALQTRLPVDADELAEQLALLEISAGRWDSVEPDMIRHLVGARGFAHCTTDRVLVTDEGRAFLAQLVAPASVQQQGAEA